MFKLKIFLIFNLITITESFCQPVFQKLVGDPQSNVAEFLFDAAIDSSGNIYYVGNNIIGSFNIAKADSMGNVLWNKSLSKNPTESGSQKIIISSDNNIIVCGYSSETNYIMKLDTSANLIWSKFWDVNSGLGGSIDFLVEDALGNFVFGGNRTDYDSVLANYIEKYFIIKSDFQGNFIWNKLTSGVIDSRIVDIILNQNGNFIFLGYIEGVIGGKDILLFEMDNSGNVIKSKVFGNLTDDFGEKLYYFNNNLIIASWDYNGTSTGKPTFMSLDTTWSINLINKILWPSSGNTLGIGLYKNQSLLICSNGPMLYLLDHNLQPTIGYNYGSSGFNRMLLKSFNTTSDGIYAIGRNLQNPEVLILKTDSMFNVPCFSFTTPIFPVIVPVIMEDTLSIQLINLVVPTYSNDSIVNQPFQENLLCSGFTSFSEIVSFNIEFDILSNPVKNTLKLKFSNSINSDKCVIVLVDVSGRKIQMEDIFNGNYIEFNISSIANGLYSVVFFYEDKFISAKKFIKLS